MAKVSNWLKVLIKETGVPFLVIGIEGKVELILKANSELSRLFAVRETLTSFQWDLANPDTLQEFADFIRATEEVVGLALPWQLANDWPNISARLSTPSAFHQIHNLLRLKARLLPRKNLSETRTKTERENNRPLLRR